MTWFEELCGFPEDSPEQVRSVLSMQGTRLHSSCNGGSWECGQLETPTLGELRTAARTDTAHTEAGQMLKIREIKGDVRELHQDPANAGALFQVASQFNLLEMTAPERTPELGVGIYEYDPTQGPACAISAGAGTIYRNYFVPVNGEPGQSAHNQIDCLSDIGLLLGNQNGELWQMKNGYALPSADGLTRVAEHLHSLDEKGHDRVRQALRIGLQWETQVTLSGCSHRVSQAYCSALPVAYAYHSAALWEPFAQLVLDAAYEATVCAGILNSRRTGNPTLYLTHLGGGAFGNQPVWIESALNRALSLYPEAGIDVVLVRFGGGR